MKVDIHIDEKYSEPEILICAARLTPELARLAAQLAEPSSFGLVGHTETGLVLLPPGKIVRVYSEGERVFAVTEEGRFRLKMRLYEAEEQLAGGKTIRISGSELANFDHVKRLDMSLAGTILLEFSSGATTFVSRRYVPVIKQLLGL
ncbi:MAG: LytTR family DNA-binding domain-containing protein [Oscillospiraceae bacterium]